MILLKTMMMMLMMMMILITVRSFFLVTGSWMVPNVDTNHHTQPLVTHSMYCVHVYTISCNKIHQTQPLVTKSSQYNTKCRTQPLVTHTVDEEGWVSPFTFDPPAFCDQFLNIWWPSWACPIKVLWWSSFQAQLEVYVLPAWLTFHILQHLYRRSADIFHRNCI